MYRVLSEEVKKHVSLLVFSLLNGMSRAFLQQVSETNDLSSGLRELIRKRHRGSMRRPAKDCIALHWLKKIPAPALSEVIDGYMAACVQQHGSPAIKRLDQWNYAQPNGRLEKSCESLSRPAFLVRRRSNRTSSERMSTSLCSMKHKDQMLQISFRGKSTRYRRECSR